MNDKMQARLVELQSELNKGNVRLTELQSEKILLQETILRIQGAITILKELTQDNERAPEDNAIGASNLVQLQQV